MDEDYIYVAFGGIFGEIFCENVPEKYATKLDELWKSYDITRYNNKLNEIKNYGFKVYRNSSGKHKVIKNE